MKIVQKLLDMFRRRDDSAERTADAKGPGTADSVADSAVNSMGDDITHRVCNGLQTRHEEPGAADAARRGDLPQGDEDWDDVPRSEELGERGRILDVDPYKPAPKLSKFERRMEKALNPRCRRRNVKHPPVFERLKSNVEAVLYDLRTRQRPISQYFFGPNYCHSDYEPAGVALTKAGVMLAGAAVADGVAAVADNVKERLGRVAREERLAKRRKYYDAAKEKRREESAEIAAATLPPENAMPTPARLLDAYRHRHDSEDAKLRFGRLMIDLDEYVRRTFVRESADGRFTGGDGGVRTWLKANCPELAAHYHTCLRFKRKVQELLPSEVVGHD